MSERAQLVLVSLFAAMVVGAVALAMVVKGPEGAFELLVGWVQAIWAWITSLDLGLGGSS